ncbi:ATP-dependent RNA helicase HrpA [Pigmentiphaga soli]|uniref:ATP-dependent RNA helicase HrpA n=1 Tax=Pigmentiphaga soli TaxID=1007095 RepID=A0ABP8GQ66_9BURK
MAAQSAKTVPPARRRNPVPPIVYPEELPVSGRRDEIARALAAHQVIIVSGETGSGKTTQLPKICLELGRGSAGMIGHTQPRRLAATSVARRIAQELNTPLGQVVGYQVRFNDRTEPGASVKLMTDGILLAESQRDPRLRAYDTLIIDEAHERSLNIDFLLGYLRQLLPRRPDLKLIITSATIDAERFARHFAPPGQDSVPVIEVSGRMYPVEVRYRPVDTRGMQAADDDAPEAPRRPERGRERERENLSRDEERDMIDAIVDAVDECARHGPGDVLVFLPGEREIREAAEALRKHHPAATEVLPLFARLSQAEQERVFHPQGNRRRIVLATNVAETSLTVPGIRFVVDSGLVRMKRYSWRNKVEQLRIEPVSQASANQRAGRCGRVGPGLCIRLYDETDFAARPRFTDPEILRSSLASVILRMKSLRLDDIERFPFVETPPGRAIADGYHLLQELGAIDDANDLTEVGRELARLPVDPRIGRMILAAREQSCLAEMLVIAAALSVQDPRDRPLEAQEAADQAHARFADERSEFMAFLKLWKWYEEAVAHKQSQRKLVEQLRQNFLSPVRLREWRDVHSQLAAVVGEQGWRLNQTEATLEQVHLALLSGLLGNIGTKSEEDAQYLGARGIRFYIHPGSRLARKAGRWVVAGELVETSRLFARCVARIDPGWIERAGRHLLQKNWSDPRWEKKEGRVVANERATLYGLTIYSGRRIDYGRIDPVRARELFIREALVPGEIETRQPVGGKPGGAATLPFIAHNRKLVAEIEKLEHKSRRPDILVDDELIFAFYDRQLPADIHQAVTLEKWYREQVARGGKEAARLLFLSRDELMRHEAAGVTTDVFPKKLTLHGIDMALDYHFEPGSPRDGVTLSVPLFALNQLDPQRCEWLVPGMLKEKVQLLLKSLPQKLRRHCVPLPEYAAGFFDRWFELAQKPDRGLIDTLVADVREHTGVQLAPGDFKLETLPAHLFMNFRVLDEHGRMLAMGRNLAQLKGELGREAQATFQQVAARDKEVAHALAHENLTDWSFGPLPELLEIRRGGLSVIGYPALVDRGTHCDLDVFDDPAEAARHHRAGLLRLFRLQLKDQVKFLEKNLPGMTQMSMLYMPLGTQEELRDQIIDAALAQACLAEPLPADAASFEARRNEGKGRVGLLAQEIARLAGAVLAEWAAAQRKLPQTRPHAAAHADMEQQMRALMPKWFIRDTPQPQLSHFVRYFKAVQARIDKLRADPARDARLMAEMAQLTAPYQRARAARKGVADPRLDEFRWMLEELRVALFAQELRTPMPVSVKRLQKAWEAMQR